MKDLQGEYSIERLNDLILKASVAFEIWSKISVENRAKYLRKLRNIIALNQDKIIDAITMDTSKPVTETVCQEITATLEMLRYLERNYPEYLKDRRSSYRINWLLRKTSIVRFEPIGIIAIIGPSNFPFSLIMMQAAVSIMCGNCVILKPSEKCPHVSGIIKELIEETEIPSGVLGLIAGDKQTAIELISNVLISKVIFTGSSQNGREVAELCGKYFKQCILELGGSGIAVICKDANIVKAAKCIAWSASYCSGESCIGTRIVLAEEDVFEEFNTQLRNELDSIRSGDLSDPYTDTNNGMNIELIDQNNGAENINNGNPVLIIKKVKTAEQAIININNSEYGLSVSVWSKNLKSALDISKQVKAGMVWINDCSTALPDFSWGGTKSSGWGRLYSKETVNWLTNLKTISIDRSRSKKGKTWWFPYNQKKYRAFKALNNLLGGKITFGSMKELLMNL